MTTTNTGAASLLPCPFCGGEAKSFEESLDERFAYANKITIRCSGCNVSVSATGIIPHGGYADNSTTEKRAVEAWNRRATTPQTDAARDVLAERQRQVNAEGWTPEHDDAHDSGQLAGAASCYAAHVNGRQWVFFDGRHDDYKSEPMPDYWPWDESWWKPTTPRRDLVKAGALILAEIERLDRAAASNGEQEVGS